MGDVIRDGAPIIEHFEAANGRPSQPAGHRQQIISVLFDVIGTDGLLRPATINRVLGGFITAFSEYIALYINKIAEYENFRSAFDKKATKEELLDLQDRQERENRKP